MNRFLKFIPSEEAFWLMTEKPNAFRLLTYIANTARRMHGNPDGLSVGQCHLQHWTCYKFTEQEYRTAKKILVDRKHIKIIETNRTRKKSTTGSTTVSTLVELCSTTVYDINADTNNDRINDRTTTEQRQTRRNKKEKEKETVCKRASAPQKKGLNMQQNYIPDIFEKSDAQGNSVTVEIKTIMLMALRERKPWSTQEIQEAWKILYEYEGPVGNCFKFIEGTIKNFRREKTAENRLKHSKKGNKSCKVTIEEIQSRKSLTECKQSNWEELLKEQDSQEQLCLTEFQKK